MEYYNKTVNNMLKTVDKPLDKSMKSVICCG